MATTVSILELVPHYTRSSCCLFDVATEEQVLYSHENMVPRYCFSNSLLSFSRRARVCQHQIVSAIFSEVTDPESKTFLMCGTWWWPPKINSAANNYETNCQELVILQKMSQKISSKVSYIVVKGIFMTSLLTERLPTTVSIIPQVISLIDIFGKPRLSLGAFITAFSVDYCTLTCLVKKLVLCFLAKGNPMA